MVTNMNRDAIDYYNSFSQDVKDFCAPLEKYFGISLFGYGRFYKNGRYLLVTNDHIFNDFYLNNMNPGNIFFEKYINCQTVYDCVLWPSNPQGSCMQEYFNFGYWHGMTFILDQNSNFIEIAGFAAQKDYHRIIEYYYKYGAVLEKFVNQFKKKFKAKISISTIDQGLAKTNRLIDNSVPEKQITTEQKTIQKFYCDIGINYNQEKLKKLTHTELRILKFVCLGFTAKHIATELGISNRTVETHLHNIKQKSGYHYKNDLIKMYQDLF